MRKGSVGQRGCEEGEKDGWQREAQKNTATADSKVLEKAVAGLIAERHWNRCEEEVAWVVT